MSEEPKSLDELAAEADEIELGAEVQAEGEGEVDVLAQLTAERDEFKDRFLRAVADAENSRRRAERDRREAENYGGSKLARDLLPVYDNMHRAIDAISEDQREAQAALIEGIELTMRELLNVFAKHGITLIEMLRPRLRRSCSFDAVARKLQVLFLESLLRQLLLQFSTCLLPRPLK